MTSEFLICSSAESRMFPDVFRNEASSGFRFEKLFSDYYDFIILLIIIIIISIISLVWNEWNLQSGSKKLSFLSEKQFGFHVWVCKKTKTNEFKYLKTDGSD